MVALGGIEDREEFASCTRGDVLHFLGVQICADVSYPNGSSTDNVGHFPLTGPSNINVNVLKVDQSITTYRFLHQIDNEEVKSYSNHSNQNIIQIIEIKKILKSLKSLKSSELKKKSLK